MEDDLITTKEVGDYRIKVYYCHDSECPITNWGLFGSFFFEMEKSTWTIQGVYGRLLSR